MTDFAVMRIWRPAAPDQPAALVSRIITLLNRQTTNKKRQASLSFSL
jgi:hypothetical protein